MKRASAGATTRERVAEPMNDGFDANELMRSSVRLTIKEALESEAAQVLGRERHERSETACGYRDGHRQGDDDQFHRSHGMRLLSPSLQARFRSRDCFDGAVGFCA